MKPKYTIQDTGDLYTPYHLDSPLLSTPVDYDSALFMVQLHSKVKYGIDYSIELERRYSMRNIRNETYESIPHLIDLLVKIHADYIQKEII